MGWLSIEAITIATSAGDPRSMLVSAFSCQNSGYHFFNIVHLRVRQIGIIEMTVLLEQP